MVFFKKNKDKEKDKEKVKDKKGAESKEEKEEQTESHTESIEHVKDNETKEKHEKEKQKDLEKSKEKENVKDKEKQKEHSTKDEKDTEKEKEKDKDKDGDKEKKEYTANLDANFVKLLHALAIPSEKQAEMMKWEDNRKIQLIQNHKVTRKTLSKSSGKKFDPILQVQVLKSLAESTILNPQEMKSQMQVVRQCVTSSVVGWVTKFLSGGGFVALLEVFRKAMTHKPPIAGVLGESIMLMKSLMNTPLGMKNVVENPITYRLVMSAISQCGVASEVAQAEPGTARQISHGGFDVLTALGLVPPDGHRRVLDAANQLDRNPRFYWILKDLWAASSMLPESHPLLVSGLSLINVIVNSPDELRVRVVLRNELFALGLDSLLSSLADSTTDEKLSKQISNFSYLQEDDMYELETKFGTIARDPVDLVRLLIRKIERTPVYTSLVSVLHNLATISSGRVTPSKIKCWRHIETSVNRIVLHDIGTTMDVDVAHLSTILNRNEFGDSVPLPWTEPRAENVTFVDGWKKVEVHSKGKSNTDSPQPRSSSELKPLPSQRRESRPPSIIVKKQNDEPGTESPIIDDSAGGAGGLKSKSMMDIGSKNLSVPSPPGPPPLPPSLASLRGETSSTLLKCNSAPLPPPPPMPKKSSATNKFFAGTTKPTQKTRTLQWKKVPENKAILTPFWSKVTHMDLASDASLLESMFAAKEKSQFRSNSISNHNERGNSENATNKLALLDPKRANNIEIMINSRLKKHPRVISEAIMTLNDAIIDAEGIHQISRALPSDDEVKKLQALSLDEVSRVGKAEQYFLELMKVPRIHNKLDCWIYMLGFEASLEEIAPSLICVRKASEQTVESKNFSFLLQIILALGNFLNFGGGQGNALGFKLDGLTKLRDVKTSDNKGSLLNVLANVLEVRHPDALGFFHDLPAIEDARKVSTQLVKTKVATLRSGFAMVSAEISQEYNEQALKKITTFVSEAKSKVEEVEALCVAMEQSYTTFLSYFGEDPATPSEEVFEMLAKFASSLASAYADNESRKRREAYQAKRSVRNRNASVASPAVTPRNPPVTTTTTTSSDTPMSSPQQQLQTTSKEQHNATQENAESARTQVDADTHASSQPVEGGIDSILQDIQTGGPDALLARRPTLESINFTPPSPKLTRTCVSKG